MYDKKKLIFFSFVRVTAGYEGLLFDNFIRYLACQVLINLCLKLNQKAGILANFRLQKRRECSVY